MFFIRFYPVYQVFLILGSPDLNTALQCVLTSAEKRDLDLLATFLLMQPRMSLIFFPARAHCWFMLTLVSTSTSRSISAKLTCRWVTTSIYWCMVLFLPRSSTFHFLLLNLMGFLLRSIWVAAQPLAYQPLLLVLCHLGTGLRVHSASSPRPLKTMLRMTGPCIDPWDTPLVTGVQLDFKPLITTVWG